MTPFTFKAQAKSNAKRFLVQTCKLENFEDYLTQDGDGQWGTYMRDGAPVPHATVRGEMEAKVAALAAEVASIAPAPAAPVPAPAPASLEEEVALIAGNDTAAAAFGALAFGQLTASTNTTPAPVAGTTAPRSAAREGATPTSGLKIQRDRPEQNGIRRQSAGSVGDKLWALYDKIGPTCTLEQAKQAATDAGLSTTSAAIALYNWRKFNGIASGRTATPAAE
jgi:hypothetical protein